MLEPIKETRRSSRRIIIPTLIVLILVTGWSGTWWFAASKAEPLIAAALSEQASRGRTITCGKRRIGGYPFRLELICENAKFEIAGTRPYTLTSPRFIAVAQIYWPSHIIAEVASPVRIDWADDGPKVALLNFSSAAASLVLGSGWRPERLSLDIKDAAAAVGQNDQPPLQIAKTHLELHIRKIDCVGEVDCYDLAAKIDAVETPFFDAFLKRGHGLSAEIQGRLSRIGVLRKSSSSTQSAQAWQQSDGAAHVSLLRAERSGITLNASGKLGLDPKGYMTGDLTADVAGADELGKTLKDSGLASDELASMLKVGLSLFGKKSDIAGKPAIKVAITFSEGQTKLGAVPIGKAPRLFGSSEQTID